jgi:hypothetical protein
VPVDRCSLGATPTVARSACSHIATPRKQPRRRGPHQSAARRAHGSTLTATTRPHHTQDRQRTRPRAAGQRRVSLQCGAGAEPGLAARIPLRRFALVPKGGGGHLRLAVVHERVRGRERQHYGEHQDGNVRFPALYAWVRVAVEAQNVWPSKLRTRASRASRSRPPRGAVPPAGRRSRRACGGRLPTRGACRRTCQRHCGISRCHLGPS